MELNTIAHLISSNITGKILKISHDGSKLFSAKSLGDIVIYDLNQSKEMLRVGTRGNQMYNSLAITENDSLFAYGYKTIVFIDSKSWKKAFTVKGNKQQTLIVKFSKSGNLVAIGGGDSYTPHDFSIYLFDVNSQKLKMKLKGHENMIEDINFDKKEQNIYSLDTNCICKSWNIKSGVELSSVRINNDLLCEINPDIKWRKEADAECLNLNIFENTASCIIREKDVHFPKVILLWNIKNGELLNKYTVGSLKSISQIKHLNEKVFAIGSNGIEIWDMNTNTSKFLQWSSRIYSLDFFPNKKEAAFVCDEGLYKLDLRKI